MEPRLKMPNLNLDVISSDCVTMCSHLQRLYLVVSFTSSEGSNAMVSVSIKRPCYVQITLSNIEKYTAIFIGIQTGLLLLGIELHARLVHHPWKIS